MAFTNSPLVSYTRISPNRNSPRNHTIDRISVHCYVGQVTVEEIGAEFASSTKGASCNYGVDKNGRVALIVEEKDRSWCTSSRDNDHRAITIETASDKTHPYTVTEAAYKTLIDLCEDICKRNGKTKLLWFGDKNTALNYQPADNEMVMTVHRWFSNKECPGEYLYSRHGEIASTVTARLSSGGTVPETDYASTIWNYFLERIGNEYGVAGLMGNLYAESALKPNNLQNSYETSLGYTDTSYTEAVDSGAYSKDRFIHDSAGYGLAQWTFWSRKQGLYEMFESGNYSSIGSIELALDYLWMELQNSYPGVLGTLKTSTTVRAASDCVLHDFERPTDQSASVEVKREEYSQYYYNKFAKGSSGAPSGPDDIVNAKTLSKLLLFAVASDRF